MNQSLLKLTDASFPICIIEHIKTQPGALFESHIHENHIQLFYFISGNAKMYFGQNVYEIKPSDLLLINKNELHYGENISDELHYFVFRIDLKLLFSYNITSITPGCITPLMTGLVLLKNHITSQYAIDLLNHMIDECKFHQEGFELKILSCIFDLLGELMRNFKGRLYTRENADILMKKTKRFAKVFEYIEKNYSHSITLSELSGQAHMSLGYFCRVFKQSTGRTPMDYINRLRIEKSVILLNQGMCNVTEAGMIVGFDDINYFSRVFKKYMKQSPEHYLKNDRKYFI